MRSRQGKQFSLYAMGRGRPGYVVDIQANRLSHFARRTVIPLLPLVGATPAIPRLNPIIEINGAAYVLATHLLATVPVNQLGVLVGDLWDRQDEIATALDVLLKGFP